MTDPVAIATVPPRKKRPVMRRMAWLGLGLILVALLAYGYTYWAARRQLQEALAEADRLDPGWRFQDLAARQPSTPDGDTVALQVVAIRRRTPPHWPDDSTLEAIPAPVQLSMAQVKSLEAALAEAAAPTWPAAQVRADLRKLAVLPRGCYPVVSFYHLGFSYDVLKVATALQLDAALLAQAGDLDGAVRACCASVNAARSISTDLGEFSKWACLTINMVPLDAIERTLAQGEPKEKALAELQELLRQDEAEACLLHMLRLERARTHEMIETGPRSMRKLYELRSVLPVDEVHDQWSLGHLAQESSLELLELSYPPGAMKNHAALMSCLNQLVEIAKRPAEEHAALINALEATLPQQPILARAYPWMRMWVLLDTRNHANLRCAIAVVAAERFRRKYGRWPATLGALVPEFLPAVPVDPFDGAPVRLHRTADGLAIYSLGEDCQDNGGNIKRIYDPNPGTDLGLRLWDVAKRRQPVPAAEAK
jgi:hypothetical protein